MSHAVRALFGGRRWLMWLPLGAAAVLDHGSFTGYLTMLVGGCVFWIPFWLACWLSDGFENVTLGSRSLEYKPGVNPADGQPCVVISNSATGAPVAWVGGDSRPHRQR